MSVIGDLASAAATVVGTVTDAGAVYASEQSPRGSDWAEFLSRFTTLVSGERLVRAWTVQYVGETRREKSIAIGQTRQQRDIRLLLRFYAGWDDGTSEAQFRDLLEAVADALDAERSLGPAFDHDPVDVEVPNNGAGVLLGDVHCHYAEVSLTAQVEQTIATS